MNTKEQLAKNTKNVFTIKKRIFKRGSTTYYYSSLFFPKQVRKEVFTLYAYVRVMDDYVDKIPARKKKFYDMKQQTLDTWSGKKSQNPIVNDFVALAKEKKFKKEWILAFIAAMESDLNHKPCTTLQESENYMHGSAEVIGLMMCAIIGLPEKLYSYAKLLGKSMQYINFIRDVSEDNMLERRYIATTILKKYNLNNLSYEEACAKPEQFNQLIREEIKRYTAWRQDAQVGIKEIPLRYRIPIQTADAMYAFTARVITQRPAIIFEKKVKPSKLRIISYTLSHMLGM
jgi:phytoene synthase